MTPLVSVVKACWAWRRLQGFLLHLLAGISPVCDQGQLPAGRGEHSWPTAWIWMSLPRCCVRSSLFVLCFDCVFGWFASKPWASHRSSLLGCLLLREELRDRWNLGHWTLKYSLFHIAISNSWSLVSSQRLSGPEGLDCIGSCGIFQRAWSLEDWERGEISWLAPLPCAGWRWDTSSSPYISLLRIFFYCWFVLLLSLGVLYWCFVLDFSNNQWSWSILEFYLAIRFNEHFRC